jgi:hypothetical protein
MHGLSSMEGSAVLRITAQTVAFRKQRIAKTLYQNRTGDLPSIREWCIQIQVEDGEAVLYPKWDLLDERVGDIELGICFFFYGQLLVLDECEGGYERSGQYDTTGGAKAYVNGVSYVNHQPAFLSALRQVAQEQTFLLR